jgi:hypothetical protein
VAILVKTVYANFHPTLVDIAAMSYTIHPDWTPKVTNVISGVDNSLILTVSPIAADDCYMNYAVLGEPEKSECMETLQFEIEPITAENTLTIKPVYSDPFPIGLAQAFRVIQNGRGAAVNLADMDKIQLDPKVIFTIIIFSNIYRHL